MKKYIITERRPCTYVWIHEVEAENEEEAMHLAMEGETNILKLYVDDDGVDSEYDVKEIK